MDETPNYKGERMERKLMNGPHGWIFYVLAALLGICLVCLAMAYSIYVLDCLPGQVCVGIR
jgi:hypothetical protein